MYSSFLDNNKILFYNFSHCIAASNYCALEQLLGFLPSVNFCEKVFFFSVVPTILWQYDRQFFLVLFFFLSADIFLDSMLYSSCSVEFAPYSVALCFYLGIQTRKWPIDRFGKSVLCTKIPQFTMICSAAISSPSLLLFFLRNLKTSEFLRRNPQTVCCIKLKSAAEQKP